MVTYSDLIQFCIFIVALVGLCYKIFKDKRKQPPLLALMTADLLKKVVTCCFEGKPCLWFSLSDFNITYLVTGRKGKYASVLPV